MRELGSQEYNEYHCCGHVGWCNKSSSRYPVVPFCPFYFGVSLFKLNGRKKGTLTINGLLGNLVLNPK